MSIKSEPSSEPQVIAFSSQLLQAEDIEPLHQDYVKLSVKSAEDLLGIINQVINLFFLQEKKEFIFSFRI